MTNNDNHPALRSKFSWQKLRMLAGYMLPGLRKQLICMPLGVIGLCLLFVGCMNVGMDSLGYISLTAIGFIFYLAPIGLARRDYRSTVAMLPLSAKEKIVFLLIYFWGVINLLTQGLAIFVLSFFSLTDEWVLAGLQFMTEKAGGISWPVFASNLMLGLSMQFFVLYGVVTAKGNRIARGVLNMVIGYGAVMVIAFFGGILFAVLNIAESAVPEEAIVSPDLLKSMVSTLVFSISGAAVLTTVILMRKLYKFLKYGGF